eukprot:464220_1
MSLKSGLCLIFIALETEIYGLDRSEFFNLHATERHDSYVSFKDASHSISFPLTLKWNRSDTSCTFSDFMYSAISHNSLYCISNEIGGPLARNINSSLYSISTVDGSINWKSYLYKTGNINTSFTGLVYIKPQYLSVLDNNFGNIYLLNSSNGDILQNLSIHSPCPYNIPNGGYCIQSGITSSATFNSTIVFYTTSFNNLGIGTIFSLDINGKIQMTQIDGYKHSVAQIPTICNDYVLITTNIFEKVDAFDLRNNLEHLWSYNVSKQNEYGNVWDYPVLCIPRNDGYFNVLVTSIQQNGVQEKWHLIDGRTGTLLREFIWTDQLGVPAVNVDKMMLIRNYAYTTLSAYNLSINDMNGSWSELWSIKHNETYFSTVVIDDYILMSNAESLVVYNIENGIFVWKYDFPNDNGPFINSKIYAGVQGDQPTVIVLTLHQLTDPIQSTLFAFT